MRSFVLACSAILALGVAAFAYLWFQPAVARRPANKILVQAPTSRPQSTTKISGLGTVEQAWIIRIDPKTGEIASRFRGDRYDPQKDNTVLVDKPEAEFYASEGKQRFHVTGRSGRVYVSGVAANQKPGQFEGKMEPPSRGQLHDVVITMFEPAEAGEPVMTMRMNNASFNNDELRVETESYVDENGKRVEADEVPVIVRGRDYDFDGRGMVMKWNELDRRLQLLEIAHGERLVIKNTKVLEKPGGTAGIGRARLLPSRFTESAVPINQVSPLTPPLLSRGEEWVVARVVSAAKKPVRKRPAAVPKPASTHASVIHRDRSSTVYRATFNDNVHVIQDGREVALADVMNVHFLNEEEKQQTPAKGDKPQEPTTKPNPAHKTGESQPSTKKSEQGPVTVTWTGKLRVIPLEDPATRPANLAAGKPQVQLLGNPVVLTQKQGKVFCGEAVYVGEDQTADLRGSQSVPLVKMTSDSGMEVLTPRMQYREVSPQLKLATLLGSSSAKIPTKGNDGMTKTIDTRWTDRCDLRLVADEQNRSYIEHADLRGGVVVDDPQMHLTSRQMELAFVPVPAREQKPKPAQGDAQAGSDDTTEQGVDVQPKQIVASGDVHAKLLDDQKREQTVAGERLQVDTETTPDGRSFARRFMVDGKVHSNSTQGELTGEHLVAMMKPSTRPAKTADNAKGSSPFASGDTDLESLEARENVRFATTQGAVATADTLRILDEDQLRRIHLIGSTTRPATVVNQQTTVTGARMRFTPDAQLAEIPCPGALHSTSQPTTNPAQRSGVRSMKSTDVAWQGGAVINGKTNLVDVTDKVKVAMVQADGTRNKATSDRLQATLVDKPKDPSKPQQAKSKDGDLVGDKDIGSATLSGNVEVISELLGPGDTLVQGFDLWAQTVTYDQVNQKMIVPVEGTMMYEDHRPAQRGEEEGPTLGSGRGKTAFEWKKSLLYDGIVRTATLNGDVAIVHKPERNQEQPFRLEAQTVMAEFEPAPATQDAQKQDAAATQSGEEKVRTKLITARDQVQVTSTKMSFDAWELTYSPATSMLTARGKEGSPGNLYNSDNGSTGVFDSLEWNTATDEFKVVNARGRVRR